MTGLIDDSCPANDARPDEGKVGLPAGPFSQRQNEGLGGSLSEQLNFDFQPDEKFCTKQPGKVGYRSNLISVHR